MNNAMRSIFVLGLLTATAWTAAPTPTAQAQEIQITGPLAGAPAVRRMRVYRDGRLQVKPTFAITMQDEFVRTGFVGLQLQYHFADWIGVGAFFQYGLLGIETDLTDEVKQRGQVTSNNRLSVPCANSSSSPACAAGGGDFSKQIGQLNFLAGLQLTFIPLRGKLGLFEAMFVDTDFYIFVGPAIAQVAERAEVKNASQSLENTICATDSAECVATQTAELQTRLALSATFGVGLSLYFTNYLGITLEYRAIPFAWNTSGTDEGGLNESRGQDPGGEFPDGEIDADDRIFHFNQLFNLGLTFYLPFNNDVTE